jgi:two-component system chemotaxis sensor kinase CheA
MGDLVAQLRRETGPIDPAAVSPRAPSLAPEWAMDLLAVAGLKPPAPDGMVALRYTPHAECFFSGDDPLQLVARVPGLKHLRMAPREPWPAPSDYDPFRCNLVIEALFAAPFAEVEALFRLIPDQVRLAAISAPERSEMDALGIPVERPRETDRQRQTMRVETDRIDALVEIAGEFITAKNSLLPLAASAATVTGDERLSRRILDSYREIERLSSALYAAVTRARMIPLDQTFRRFPRLVRETSARLGKLVDLVIDGATIEADREIVEELFEPLLHLIRNALDHGIEAEAERAAALKPARGVVSLSAEKRGEQVVVRISDDGRGLDPARLRSAAVAKGLITPDAAAALDDQAALQLIFLPGFSTARAVSDVSGRGVGLDAVQASIARIGGRVDVRNRSTTGATFELWLPVSFTMSHLMIVRVGEERYGIPVEKVVEALRVSRQDIHPVRAGHAFVLRGRTIPLLSLPDLLELPLEAGTDADAGTRPIVREPHVLVVDISGERIGLVVDAIAERTETPMRPIARLLRGLPGIAGTTLLGDGQVLLVLNLEELIA